MPNPYRDAEKYIDDHGPTPEPQTIFSLECWGGGNYFITDHCRGKSIRLIPEMYWKIVDYATILMDQSRING